MMLKVLESSPSEFSHNLPVGSLIRRHYTVHRSTLWTVEDPPTQTKRTSLDNCSLLARDGASERHCHFFHIDWLDLYTGLGLLSRNRRHCPPSLLLLQHHTTAKWVVDNINAIWRPIRGMQWPHKPKVGASKGNAKVGGIEW